ncbi:MAG: tyrosine-type recombinase/integrase [Mycobacterium sp.]
MATIEKYETRGGATLYRVRYRTPDNRGTQKRGFTTKRDAERWANRVEVAKMTGDFVAPSSGRITIDELGPAWLERRRGYLKPSAYAPLESAWRLHVQTRWGRTPLAEVRTSAVGLWVTELSHSLSPTVVRRTHQVLSGVLADAVRDNLIARNLAAGVKLPRLTSKRKMYLTHGQVQALADAAGEHGALVLTLAYTGLRWGEAVGMRVRDLDMLRRRAAVVENAVQVGATVHVGTPKTHKQRTVPLPEFLLPYLARQCEGKDRTDLLFPGLAGDYLRRPRARSGWWDKAIRIAGLPRLTPHELRHTAASLAVSAGANVKAVQRMLGHASAAMTLDLYADLFDDDLEAVAVALDAARSREIVATAWPRGFIDHP